MMKRVRRRKKKRLDTSIVPPYILFTATYILQQVGELIVVEVAGNPVAIDSPDSVFPLYDREHTIGSQVRVFDVQVRELVTVSLANLISFL